MMVAGSSTSPVPANRGGVGASGLGGGGFSVLVGGGR